MLYVFTLMDSPGAAELRQQIRPMHMAYLAGVRERIAFAGPLTTDDGGIMKGSLLVIDFPHRQAAEELLAQEPFVRTGVFATTSIHAFLNLWPQKAGFPT